MSSKCVKHKRLKAWEDTHNTCIACTKCMSQSTCKYAVFGQKTQELRYLRKWQKGKWQRQDTFDIPSLRPKSASVASLLADAGILPPHANIQEPKYTTPSEEGGDYLSLDKVRLLVQQMKT